MTNSRWSYVAIPVALAMLATACGKDRSASTTTETAVATAPSTTLAAIEGDTGTPTTVNAVTTEPAPLVEMFGDAPWPCGPALTPNTDAGTEPGVTAESISIGTGDDAGNPVSPGLNSQMTDAINAMAKRCNELGGINGRQIKVDYFDAKLFDAKSAMQAACDAKEFMMVGQGWAFDSDQEEIRLGCGLPSFPTYSVSAAFAHGPMVFNGLPNPADETPSGMFAMTAKLFPDQVQAVGSLVGNFAATRESRDKVLEAAPQFGWNFVSSDLEYEIGGESDWTPLVKQLQEAGVKMLYWSGSCLPNLQLFAQTAKANGFEVPIVTDAGHYEQKCAEANTDGALDNVYVRFAYVPFEDAAVSPATQNYLDIVQGDGGEVSLLGMQATSSFLLWATAASQCGAELTRQCTLDNASKIHEWTGHGLHAQVDSGGNHTTTCNTILRIQGTTFVRVAPEAPATYECDPAWLSAITKAPALAPLRLDENRVSHQFG